jgi:GGDEF domain-containing protein
VTIELPAISRELGEALRSDLRQARREGPLSPLRRSIFADRLRRRIDEYTFGPTGSPTTVTISVGGALTHGSDPTSTELLLQEADAALHRAKTAGRNRVFS